MMGIGGLELNQLLSQGITEGSGLADDPDWHSIYVDCETAGFRYFSFARSCRSNNDGFCKDRKAVIMVYNGFGNRFYPNGLVLLKRISKTADSDLFQSRP